MFEYLKQSNVVKLNNVFYIIVFDRDCNKHRHKDWGKCIYIYFLRKNGNKLNDQETAQLLSNTAYIVSSY